MTDFYLMRRKAGLDRAAAAEMFKVTERTITNWDAGKKPPTAVFLYLSVLCGELDHLGNDWKGFRFVDNCIMSPEGEFLYAYEVRAIKYLWAAAGLSRGRKVPILQSASPTARPSPTDAGKIVPFTLAKSHTRT